VKDDQPDSRRRRPGSARSARACAVAVVLQAALAGGCAAADVVAHLRFAWARPTPAAPCELEDPGAGAKRQPLRLAGNVESSDALGVACTVQIPRRRFDALYRFCNVENVDAVPRERYACWVMYSPTHVTFLYSYADDYYGAPACEFACTAR
jgi:hypothetical protein